MQAHHEKDIAEKPEALFIAIIQMAHILDHQIGFPLVPDLKTPKLPQAVYRLLTKAQPEFSLDALKQWLPEIKKQLAQLPALAG